MSNKIERSGCRFSMRSIDGKLQIEMELFHATMPTLASVNLSFEVLRGIQPEQARELVDKMNDVIIGIALAPQSNRVHFCELNFKRWSDRASGEILRTSPDACSDLETSVRSQSNDSPFCEGIDEDVAVLSTPSFAGS